MDSFDGSSRYSQTTVISINDSLRHDLSEHQASYSDFQIENFVELKSFNKKPQIQKGLVNLNHLGSIPGFAINQTSDLKNCSISNSSQFLTKQTSSRYPHNYYRMRRGENAVRIPTGNVQELMNEATLIERGQMKFLILDCPSNAFLETYIQTMNRNGVKHLVRTCQTEYETDPIKQASIGVHDLIFADGKPPPLEIIKRWQEIVKETIKRDGAVAVHCFAGLGRAPTLVAISLIDSGMSPSTAINLIREKRQGAFNRNQVEFLQSYKKKNCVQRCIQS